MKPLKVHIPGQIPIVWLIVALLATACQPAAGVPATPSPPPHAPTLSTPETTAQMVTATPDFTPSPTQIPNQIWLPDYLPEELIQSLVLPPGVAVAEREEDANFQLVFQTETGQAVSWVYALVAPFPTIEDEISLNELMSIWRTGINSDTPPQRLIMDEKTLMVFEMLWGPASAAISKVATEKLLDSAWREPGTWAIIPFEQLEPRWKVLMIDGQSPVQKTFDPLVYQLIANFDIEGEPVNLAEAKIQLPAGNRRPSHLTTVVLTGVTALVRGTASLMKILGKTYPAQDIGGWLREADILHISNEVPFARNCPLPFDWEGLVFCSQTENIELLEHIGTDVVELSGDHFKDWGFEATLYTIDLYEERGWQYYGGGRNADEAWQPALFEHNGHKIAFIGCNAKPPGYSSATDTTPGAVHCDFELLESAVRQLRQDGYLPIVTFQHLEYYSYEAHPILQEDFHRVAAAGAVIVSGSQAHQPHAFEFTEGALLHYGLGNLFFDQTNQGEPPRTAFIDRHVFYGGRHISTELLTIYLVDYARSRPMTLDERQALLRTVFEAGGWDVNQPKNWESNQTTR